MSLHLKITTPERIVFEDKVAQVTLSTVDGEITILPGHIPLVSLLKPGEIMFKKEEQEHYLAVAGGFVQVQDKGKVIILADSADWLSEIDETKAQEAKARASKILEDKNLGEVEYASVQTSLHKALAQLHVAGRRKNRGSKTFYSPDNHQ